MGLVVVVPGRGQNKIGIVVVLLADIYVALSHCVVSCCLHREFIKLLFTDTCAERQQSCHPPDQNID